MAKRVNTKSVKDRLQDGLNGATAVAELPEISGPPEHTPNGSHSIDFPVGELVKDGYREVHLDMHMRGDQAKALLLIADGCDRAGHRLTDGTRVISPTHAIRWLLEQASVASNGSERSERSERSE